MKKSNAFYPNSGVIIFLVMTLLGTGILSLTHTCYAQSPWIPKANMPSSRWDLSSCVVDGKIYAIGGAYRYAPRSYVEVYDPVTDTWMRKSDMPTARLGLSTSVVNGKIYAIGGGLIESTWSNGESFKTVEEYDPATDTWATKSEMLRARGWHSAVVLDGKIYIIGGADSPSGPSGGVQIRTVDVYDPSTDSWSQKGNIPRSRICDGSASMVDGKIYAFGGWGGEYRAHEYDPVTDTWSDKKNMPQYRTNLSTSVVDGMIYAIGGGYDSVDGPVALETVDVYDPSMDTWETGPSMLNGRSGLGTAVIDGKIYAFGGWTGRWRNFSETIKTVEVYDPSTAPTDIERIHLRLPRQIKLNQNHPNPFNPATTIQFSLPQTSHVTIEIYSGSGRHIETLIDGTVSAGIHRIQWNGSEHPSGIYICRLKTDQSIQTRKLILQK